MSHLSISLLGLFQVRRGGEPVVGFESDKVRALLAYLAVEAGQPHRRESLAGLLWPDFPERSARTNLRNALVNLRHVIGDRQVSPPFLDITRQTIQFNQTSDYALDIARWTELLAPDDAAQPRIARLEQAITLYQGPFLAGFSLADCPTFEEWVLLQREALALQMAETLHHLATHYEEQRDYPQALAYARHWLALDAWQEEAHQQVMRLLARCGRRSEALHQYKTCRRVLADELGLEPSQETARLFEQIQAEELSGTQPVALQPRHNLPVPLTSLIGREVDLTALSQLLADPALRLVTIVGPGGVGKTHLALEAVAAQVDRFPNGVYLISLAPLQSADFLATTIVEALQFSFYDHTSPEQQLRDYLKQKEILLVLDNFEHLLAGVDLLIDLLQTAPALKLLLTSRTPLHIQGEQLYPLTGLTYPAEADRVETVEGVNEWQYSALTLFDHSARRLRPDFALSDENLDLVIRICQLVEGMPLALLLASAWIKMLTLSEIAAEIERGFAFLHADLQNLPPRQRSLQAIFSHSWQLLSPREQSTLAQLSIFRGGFLADVAQAITGAELTDLLTLVDKCLLHRSPTERYEIHELLRQFAAQKLAMSPENEVAVRDRHSAFYAAFLHQRETDLKGSRQQEALAEMRAESENIRLAWQWMAEHDQIEHLDQAINSLGTFYQWRGRYEEGEIVCHLAVASLGKLGSEAALALAKLLRWQARFNRLFGNSEAAVKGVQRSLRLLDDVTFTEPDVQLEKATTLLELGQQREATSRTEAADFYEQALSLYRSLHDRWGTAQASYMLASLLLNQQQPQGEGEQLMAESLQLFQTLGDQRSSAGVLEHLGFDMTLRGQHEQGVTLLKRSLALRQEMKVKAEVATSLHIFGYGLINAGQFNEAHHLAEEGLRLAQDLGNTPMIIQAQTLLASTILYQGYYQKARSLLQINLRLCKELDMSDSISFILWELGDIALAEGTYIEAERVLQKSVAIHQTVGERGRQYDVLVSLGLAACGLGNIALARRCLGDALHNALELHIWFSIQLAIPLAALLALKQGDPARAVELYALALSIPHIANARYYEDAVERHIAAAAKKLPPDVVAAAQERGRGRDLWETARELRAALEDEKSKPHPVGINPNNR